MWSGAQSAQPTFLYLLIIPQNSPNQLFLSTWCFSVCQTSAKRKNQIGKAKRDAGNEFLDFLWKLPKNHYRKCTKKDFYEKFQMQRYIFVGPIWLYGVSCIFTGSLAQSAQEIWSIEGSPATVVASAVVKGAQCWDIIKFQGVPAEKISTIC